MEEQLKICFISNYINHHQIPFCDAMTKLLGDSFWFIQTMQMEEERKAMGWHPEQRPSYVRLYYEEEEACKKLIDEADVVLFGGVLEESYIAGRLAAKRPVIRVDERMYKEGQWKAISPRGLIKKYKDHTRHKKDPVYFLCAGAYVADDLNIIGAYPGKKFCWGYFPPTKTYDLDALMSQKKREVPLILWAARMIDWKHPELVLAGAKALKEKGIPFRIQMVGSGPLEEEIAGRIREEKLEDSVELLGAKSPEQVRELMEQANIFLMTSDRKEGWGAVANESMNSGCALLADRMTGAALYLVEPENNGLLYESSNLQMFIRQLERLATDSGLCEKLGRNAYRTIVTTWNAEYAAKALHSLIQRVVLNNQQVFSESGKIAPGEPAPIIKEKQQKKRRK